MSKFNKLFICAMLLLMLFLCINASSAAEPLNQTLEADIGDEIAAIDDSGDELGASGETFVVDADGGGNYTTISSAVSAATGGETIFIKNGNYSVTSKIDIGSKQLTITGESQDGVIITAGNNDLFYTTSKGYSSLVFSGLTFKDIPMSSRSPIYVAGDGNVTIANCTFDNCTSNYGSVRIATTGSALIENCTFFNTKSAGDIYSSAIDFSGSSTKEFIIRNTVIDCSSISSKSSSSYMWGAIYNERQSGIVILDNVTISNFDGNGKGSGLVATKGNMNISNSKFINNTLYKISKVAGLFYVMLSGKTMNIESSIIANNSVARYIVSVNGNKGCLNMTNNTIVNNTYNMSFAYPSSGIYDLDANYWGSNSLPEGIPAKTWIVKIDGETYVQDGSIYVSVTGDDSKVGLRQQDAVKTIARAIELAEAGVGKIVLLEGTHVLDATLQAAKDLNITGQGNAVIDANGKGFIRTNASLILNSLELINGHCPDADLINVSGSGSTLTLNDVNFHDNAAKYGIAVQESTKLFIYDSEFHDNDFTSIPDSNARIYINSSDAVIENTVFMNNRANNATAIAVSRQSGASTGSQKMKKVTVSNNTADGGNGILAIVGNNTIVNIANSTFINNYASGNGGAIYMAAVQGKLTVDQLVLKNNTGNSSAGSDSGIYASEGTVAITNSILLGNETAENCVVAAGNAAVTAEKNWWGNNEKANTNAEVASIVKMNAAMTPALVLNNQQVTVTATFDNKKLPYNAIGVAFTSTGGNLNEVVGVVAGNAMATFTINLTDEVITVESCNAKIEIPVAFKIVVTNDTFFDFFDGQGALLYPNLIEELIFNGTFSNLTDVIVISAPIRILGDNATLKDIAFKINSGNVSLSNMAFNSDKGFAENGDALIYSAGNGIEIRGVSIKSSAGAVNISGSNTTFADNVIGGTVVVSGNDNRIEDNTIISSGDYAVDLKASVGNNVSGNYLISAGSYGYHAVNLVGSGSALIENNSPSDPEIIIDVENITAGEDAIINITVNENQNGTADVWVEGQLYPVDIFNGFGNLTLTGLFAKDYVVTASFKSLVIPNWERSNSTVFNVAKLPSDMVISVSGAKLGSDTVIVVSIPGATGNVTVIVNGKKNKTALDANGNASHVIYDIAANDYFVSVFYLGDRNHDSAYGTVSFTVPSTGGREWYVNASSAGGNGFRQTPFKDFQSALDCADEGDTIYFAAGEEYIGNGNVKLEINKGLNLAKYGGGEAVFDAKGKSRIFTVTASSFNITGLTFKNGRVGDGDEGGALYFTSDISNSYINATFISNVAGNGAAICFDGAVSDSTIAGTYERNNVTWYGGAILFDDDVTGSTIIGTYVFNKATYGGANYFTGDVTGSTIAGTYEGSNAAQGAANGFGLVSNSNISGTYVGGNAYDGAANYFEYGVSDSSISGTYIGNTARNNGAAYYFDAKVSNSNITGTYINNTATNGAIMLFNSNKPTGVIISDALFINNNYYKRTGIIYAKQGVTAINNWFGNNASDYDVKPTANVEMNTWLFLNATANPDSLPVSNSSDVTFKLYSYDSSGVSEYDAARMPVNLTLTAVGGDVAGTASLNETVEFVATEYGDGSVTARFENVQCTVLLNIRLDSDLSVGDAEADYGQELIINLDYNDAATGTVNITLEGKKHNKSIENIALNKTIQLPDGILPDEYDMTVSYSGDGMFKTATANATLTVRYLESNIEVQALNINVTDANAVMFTIALPENATGNMTIINGETIDVAKEGKKESGLLIVEILNNGYPVGKYNWTFTYLGDEIYADSSEWAVSEIMIIQTEIIPANKTINLAFEDDSKINYTTNPNDLQGIAFKSNNSSVVTVDEEGSIKAVGAGSAEIAITFAGNETYNASSATVSVTVSKIDSTVNVGNVTLDYGTYLMVPVTTEGADGITAKIDDSYVDVCNNVILVPGNLSVGNHTLVVATIPDANHNSVNETATITVFAVDLHENTTIELDVEVFEDRAVASVNVNPNATGLIMFNVTGDEEHVFYMDVIEGESSSDIFLEPGSYSIAVTYMGDSRFNPNATSKDVTIVGHVKKDTSIRAVPSVDASTVTIDVNVNESATGFVAIEVLGQTFMVDVENGVAVFTYDFFPGTYNADIAYMGDDNFNGANTTVSFTVIRQDAVLKNTSISVDVSSQYNDVAISAYIDSAATGLIEFNIDGKAVYLPVNNGEAVYSTELPAGEYELTVTYLGDEKFNGNSTSRAFAVEDYVKKNTTISAVAAVEGHEVTITVNVDGSATGFVEFVVDGNAYYDSVVDGKAFITIFVPAGTYDVEVAYLGDDYFNANATEITVEVTGDSLENTTIELDVEVFEDNAVAAVNVNPNATGFVKFEVTGDGEYVLYMDVVEGESSCVIFLESGNYSIAATYLGDSRFNANATSKDFAIVGHIKKDTFIRAVPHVDATTVTIDVSVNESATGFVAIEVLGQTFIVPVEGGNAVFAYDFFPGTYNANVAYTGDDDFNNASTSVSFTVIRQDAELKNTSISVDVSSQYNDVAIAAAIDSAATGLIEFNIDGKAVYLPVNDGKAVYSTDLPAGDYNVVVTYLGDDNFNGNSTSKAFSVTDYVKRDTAISADVDVVGNVAAIAVHVDGNATGFVEFSIGEFVGYMPVIDGNAEFVIALPDGNYAAVIEYLGDKYFNGNSTVKEFSITHAVKSASEFTNITVGGDFVVTAVLTDMNGNPIANANLTCTVNGKAFDVVTDENGIIAINASANSVVELVFAGNDNALPANTTITLKDMAHARKATIIKAQDYTTYAIDFYTGERGGYFKVQLVDENASPLANKSVKIGFNGKVYDTTTNANGWAQLQINLMYSGLYTFAVAYMGDDDYNGSFVVQKINVNKKKTSISAAAKTFKATAKTKSYTVTLKTDQGSSTNGVHMASGKKVTLKLNGKTYTAKTNSKGQATFKLSITKKGKFVTAVKFAGDNTYLASSKSVKITIK